MLNTKPLLKNKYKIYQDLASLAEDGWDGGAGSLSITSNFDLLRRRWLEAIRRNRKVNIG